MLLVMLETLPAVEDPKLFVSLFQSIEGCNKPK